MIPFKKRKHKQVDPNDTALRPLKQKSTNVRGRRTKEKGKGTTDTQSDTAATHSKGNSDARSKWKSQVDGDVVFYNENVSIRLVEEQSLAAPSIADDVSGVFTSLRRQNQDAVELSQRSIQLEDFDQPPASTSTPLVSPQKQDLADPDALSARLAHSKQSDSTTGYKQRYPQQPQAPISPIYCKNPHIDYNNPYELAACLQLPRLASPGYLSLGGKSNHSSPSHSHTYQSSGAQATYQGSSISRSYHKA
ncbi:uncharacterized protein Ecym_4535 [Eremothecium cymbalariae DBVPG|uniref:Uncharacterized protein n=1 Tax=Eremothecium cymbalariae (strain CBS 270.75 / DBVPG 7215 / KCTC 17166 / NRRL Y-17582) TaxID=931890 RepID=G8JU68_ERECY|nr:hypothetical protein Ecym_4535 [Eremothecium cymbalariae DBVPG\